MLSRALRFSIFVLCSLFIYGATYGQIVYVDIEDILCNATHTWTWFFVGNVDYGRNANQFGCWYDAAGGGFLRFETYYKKVIGESVNVVDVTGQNGVTTANLTPLVEGEEIGPSSNWQTTGDAVLAVSNPAYGYYPNEPFFYHEGFTDWAGETAYVGSEVYFAGQLHYMWFRFSVSDDGTSYTLHDYAYNSVPGEPINAGQTTTGVEAIGNKIPMDFSLNQNFPNPFNPSTKITYSIPKASQATLTVYNLMGQEIAVLVNAYKTAGSYSVDFNANGLPAGIYIYKLRTHEFTDTKKMLLVK